MIINFKSMGSRLNGLYEKSLFTVSKMPEWEQFTHTFTYRKWYDEALMRLMRTPHNTYAITTFDGLYKLETQIASIPGWLRSYRTDNPYAETSEKFSATPKQDQALDNLVMAVLRYQYETARYGQPLVDWSKWSILNNCTKKVA